LKGPPWERGFDPFCSSAAVADLLALLSILAGMGMNDR
jgi:hypothetical protein